MQIQPITGRKEMFYLTMHSTHFLFKVIWHRTHGLLFPISSKGSFIDTIAQTWPLFTSRGALVALQREIAQWVHDEGLI